VVAGATRDSRIPLPHGDDRMRDPHRRCRVSWQLFIPIVLFAIVIVAVVALTAVREVPNSRGPSET